MSIATGIAKKVRYKKEAANSWGVLPGPTGGQELRRTSSNLDLKKDTYQSSEIRPDMQRADFRHGQRKVDGTISGELSPGSYEDFFASVLRQDWQTAATTGAIITVAATVAGPQFTRSGGSFITDGFRLGDVVRWIGWTAAAVANNNRNFLITSLTALQMTGIFLDGTAVAAKAAGDSVTCTLVGKKTWTPLTGQVNDSYTIEHWFSDILQSEVFTGCRISQMDIKLPATGMATIDIQFMGKDMVTAQTAYFTSPAGVSTSGILAAVNGAVILQGAQAGLITAMDLSIKANMSTGAVVGSNVAPDIFMGPLDVTGNLSVYFQDQYYRDYFVNETEVSIIGAFTTNNLPNADFIAFNMQRVKVGGAGKDDGEKGLILSMPFTALLPTSTGTGNNTTQATLAIQDSLAV